MPRLIKDWEELKDCTSETHILEIDDCCGWVHPKNDLEFKVWDGHYYLSTHTFYGQVYKESTEMLQKCGFDVELSNWDDEDEIKTSPSQHMADSGHFICKGLEKTIEKLKEDQL